MSLTGVLAIFLELPSMTWFILCRYFLNLLPILSSLMVFW